jgi:choline dehydrogenase-like flavoprotein
MILPLTGLAALPAMHTKTFAINAYYESSPDWPYPTGVVQAAGQMPFWANLPRWQRPAAKLIANRSLYCFYMTEALPSKASGFEFNGPGEPREIPPVENTQTFLRMRRLAVEAFRRAGYRSVTPGVKMLFHGVGTVRFGSDPATSVLDPECRVHGVQNVFVADASVFPSAGAMNNTLTIAALALRTGDVIARQLSVADGATSAMSSPGTR